jgi:regulator of G-protein signaling
MQMESLVKEMQDPESGVPVRSQKIFLTSIPSAFMGYDLIEWLMERLNVEESEALNMANQLCQHGYFFPVNDSKTLVVKDDSSLYRFQSPYYWPWRQQKAPDQIEYAIYLAKRSLRNKQRHGLEDYENEALASLNKNLKGKWDFIMMQAEEQIKLSKDRKKGDKIVSDSQERAYWRVHRPPPGQFTPLEPCPVPSRDRQGKPRKRTEEDWKREVKITRSSLGRNRMKMSAACESLVSYYETFAEYDPLMQPALPSNPWVSEDITFWQLNSPMVEVPTEKRVKRWAISIEELIKDPTGLIEFTTYLRKEYSHENIRFWLAVIDLRRSSQSQIARKAKEIYS